MNAQMSTWIVAPVYLGQIYGYDAVEVTTQKAHLIAHGKRVLSRFVTESDKAKLKEFGDWVTYITGAA